MSDGSLFARIGGAAAVDAAVDLLYIKLLAHDMLKPFFEGIDMKRLARHQARFLTFAFGGAKQWTGPSMYRVHRRLIEERGLNMQHFDAVAGVLVEVLQELSVPQALIDEVLAIVAPLRPVFDPAYKPTAADLAPPQNASGATQQADSGSAPAAEAQVASAEDAAAQAAAGTTTEAAASDSASLFDRIGGAVAVEAAVDLMYGKLLANDTVKRFFEGTDMKRLARHQARFLTYAFGGAKRWTGPTMYRVHRRMIEEQGLNTQHFDAVVGVLVEVLQELSVPQALIDEVLAIVGPLRPIFDPSYKPTAADLAPAKGPSGVAAEGETEGKPAAKAGSSTEATEAVEALAAGVQQNVVV